MNKWQAVVFDLDDTLYPEQTYVLSGFRAVASWAQEQLGIPADQGFLVLQELYVAGVRGDTFNRWLQMLGFRHSRDVVLKLVQVYREHDPQIYPFPEVTALLAELRQRFRLGLLSDGYLRVQQRKLRALKLGDYFDAVVFSDELGREYWKPSPKPFWIVLQRLGIEDPGVAVYVADNPLKDFLGATQIGMSTVWVRWQGGEYTHLIPPTEAHRPNIEVNTLTDLVEMLNKQSEKRESPL